METRGRRDRARREKKKKKLTSEEKEEKKEKKKRKGRTNFARDYPVISLNPIIFGLYQCLKLIVS